MGGEEEEERMAKSRQRHGGSKGRMVKTSPFELGKRIDVALGRTPADLVLRNARILDLCSGNDVQADIAIAGEWIAGVDSGYRGTREIECGGRWVVPGFIDAHVHVESSLMTPFAFEKALLPRGVTAVICDPHEIANVLGLKGIRYVLSASEKMRLDLFVMLPSCVPASPLETSGHRLEARALETLRGHSRVLGLAEMMNFPGVLGKDKSVLEKISGFSDGIIDGHSPTLRGSELNAYLACRIGSCHESVTVDEAREKIRKGMTIFLREGSVAKDLARLLPVVTQTPETAMRCAFCTDDRNPADIHAEGHIDVMCRRAIAAGVRPVDAYRMASTVAANFYGLRDRGVVAPGYRADVVILDDLETCQIHAVVKNGVRVTPDIFSTAREPVTPPRENTIRIRMPNSRDLAVRGQSGWYRVIEIIPNSLVTKAAKAYLTADNMGNVGPDIGKDVAKLVVLERHRRSGKPAVGFVTGFSLKDGALGSSVGHDSHNLVVVGTNDRDILCAIRKLKAMKGGFCVVSGGEVRAELSLPIAGLMTSLPFDGVVDALASLRSAADHLGCRLTEPFLQTAFLSLSVIPELKLTDKGLVDVIRFEIVDLYLGAES